MTNSFVQMRLILHGGVMVNILLLWKDLPDHFPCEKLGYGNENLVVFMLYQIPRLSCEFAWIGCPLGQK